MGRSSRGDCGDCEVKRAEKWVKGREVEGCDVLVSDIGDTERNPTRDARGRIGDDLIELKVLKRRKRGRNLSIVCDENDENLKYELEKEEFEDGNRNT